MTTDEEYAAFLDSIHLFQGMSDDDLFDIVDHLEFTNFEAGDVILEEGVQSESFYIIFSGEVEVINKGKGQKRSTFRRRDFLGEEVLLSDETRQTLVQAKNKVLLLELSSSAIAEISEALSFLTERLELSVSCRKLTKELHFDWLGDDEGIYFVVHKHIAVFWKGFSVAFLLGIFGILSASWGMWVGFILALIAGGISLLASAVLSIWYWVDWHNDYYIITSQRVVWLEKVVGIHESRQDAYLHEILSVGSSADWIGEQFDFATLNIRTKVDGMDLEYASCPRQARALIEELWHHATEAEKKEEEDQWYQAIADRIESAQPITPSKMRPAPPPPPAPVASESSSSDSVPAPAPAPKKRFSMPKRAKKAKKPKKDRHILNLRYQEGAEVIYRKHWILLIRNAIGPVLITLFLFGYGLFQLYLYIWVKSDSALAISFSALLIIAGFISSGGVVYQYMDWSDDIFKVSPSKVFDIDRKPFGDVQSRSAPLENIESTEYKRRGFISIIFNYGTVYIHVGTESFEFQNVFDPASVQQDINRRYMASIKRKKAAEARAERDQMLDWFVAYHQGEEKFRSDNEIS